MAGALISNGLMLCASILVARMLGKNSFGELGMIQSTIGMFGVFAGFGLGVTATKHVAEFRSSDPERVGRILALSMLIAIVAGGFMSLGLFFFAPWLAGYAFSAPHLSGVLRIAALILFFGALNGAQTGALSGFEAFKTIAKVNLLVGVISFPILIGGAYFGGLNGAVWGLAVNLCVNWFCNYFALRKEARRYKVSFTFVNCSQELSVLWRFSLPVVLAGVMVGPINWVCSALLVNRPNGYAEMGVFNAANQWFTALLFLPNLLGQVVLPVLSERLGQKDKSQSMQIMVLAIKVNFVLVFPFILFMSLISPYIMGLYGDGFQGGWPTFVIVLLTTGLYAVQTPVAHVITASGKIWTGFVMNMGWGVAFLGFTYLLLQHGAFGLGLARFLAYVLHALWTFWFAVVVVRRMRLVAVPGKA